MLKEKLVTVSEEDKNEMLKFFERKMALSELLLSIDNPVISKEADDNLYEKIIYDMGKTQQELDNYWNVLAQKYNLKGQANMKWVIDFEANEVFLEG